MKLSSSLIPLLSALLCFGNDAMAQASSDDGAVRISIVSGGNVPFVINSLEKWENGATLPNWTTIRISITDSAGTNITDIIEWQLRFNAQDIDGDSKFDAEDPGNLSKIALNTIQLTSFSLAGCGAILDLPATKELRNTEQTLVTGTIPAGTTCADNILSITYDCGSSIPPIANSLMNNQNAAADYYTEIIIFTLYGCGINPCPP